MKTVTKVVKKAPGRRSGATVIKSGKGTVSKKLSSEKRVIVREILNGHDYNRTIADIEKLVKAGVGTIRNQDMELYSNLAKAVHEYEQKVYTIESPRTLEGLLEWKMYELKLKQKELARKLHVSDTKLSLVMSGKQKPDASLLKSIHRELGIDGNILLGVV